MHAIRKMSTHHGRRTSLVRAKTSIGRKTSHQECMESVSELLVALEKERQMEQVMMKSVEQWTEIVDEITTSMDSATPSETEWKNRFHYQRLFNEMLTQEIGHIKTELYMLGQGRTGMTLPVTEHAQSKSPRSNHHRESQTYIKCLQEKLKSLESKYRLESKREMEGLYNMYEHQRDDASRDYHRLKEEINKIVKDVAFKQRTRITSQEEWDKKEITRPKNAGKTLPPLKGTLRNKTSYLKLHEVKSGTSKIADKGKSSHMWKGAGKLPPVNNTRRNKKDKNLSSDKSKRPQGVQEKWTNVSKADVLPPIGKANCNREVDKSKLKGHGQRDKSLLTDPKLPSMRMKRIASLKTDSDGVTSAAIRKERVRGGVRGTDTGTHEGYVCHVDDQRAGSSCNEDITQAGIMTGYNTKKSIGERSERNREGCVENKCGTSIVNNDDNMCSLGRKSPTSTTVKSPFRKSKIEVLNGENMLVSNQSLHQKETRSLSKSTTTYQPDDNQQHELLPVGNISPKLPRKRIKTALVRSNSKGCGGGNMDMSPCRLGITPSGHENQISVVYKESKSPLDITTDDKVYMAEDTPDTGAGRSNVDEIMLMAEDNLNTRKERENSEQNPENDNRSPKSKGKSVTINDKTTVHYP